MVLWGLFGEEKKPLLDVSTIDEGMNQIIAKSIQNCMSTTANSNALVIDCNNKSPEMLDYCNKLNDNIKDTAKINLEAARLLAEVSAGTCSCVVNNVSQDLNATVNITCALNNNLDTEIEKNLINSFTNDKKDEQDILSKFVQAFTGDKDLQDIIAPVIDRSTKIIDKSSVQEGIQAITNSQTMTINGGLVSNLTQRAVTQTIYATMLKSSGMSKLVSDLKNFAINKNVITTQPLLCTLTGLGCDLSSTSQTIIMVMIVIAAAIVGYLCFMYFVKTEMPDNDDGDNNREHRHRHRHKRH